MKWNRTICAELRRLLPLVCALNLVGTLTAAEPSRWWTDAVELALVASGENRAELTKALVEVPILRREGMSFLIENMPRVDLEALSATYLLDHVAQGYDAVSVAPWGRDLPREVFLNDVLPYASLNEARDGGRRRLRELSAPLVKECRTPGEAAQVLNRKLFRLVNVRYSTERKKPDQSAVESISSGLATCSGLAILLVDACRSVGVPARVVGTPMWTNLRGNHTWVEVWDGTWHFTGAAEPDPNGLDRGWFKGDAAKARAEVPRHAIYASSFKKTGLSFPLVWNRRIDWVNAVNVTERYAPAASAPATAGSVRVLVRVLDRDGGKRVGAKVTMTDPADGTAKFEGTSRDESADLNDLLPFQLTRNHAYTLRVEHAQTVVERALTTGAEPEQIVTIALAK